MKLTCTVCPMGCSLILLVENRAIKEVKGARCKRGDKYAVMEFTCPKRMLTSIVRVDKNRMLSVKSDKPLPKDRFFEFMDIIKKISVLPPIEIGDIIIDNIYDDVNIVATKNIY